MLVNLLQLQTKSFASNFEPMVVRKVIPTAEQIASSWLKEPSDAIKKIDSQSSQNDAHYHSSFIKYLVQSFGLIQSFDLVQSFVLVRSFDLGGFCLFSLKDFPFVLVINLFYFPLDVVEDALAQGAEGLRLMQNEDHQVLGNEQKLEEDASYCTRVDDDGVEFSPEGATQDGDYVFAPTLQSMNLLTALLVSHGSEMNVCFSLLAQSCERLLLKAKPEFSEQPIMQLTEFKSGLMHQGAGLDELKHVLSIEESVAHKCKDAIIKNEHKIMSLYGRANIKPNKVNPEEVADLDLD
ncbi:hypothetical protein Tco_0640603 [Tanacetum coccineum]